MSYRDLSPEDALDTLSTDASWKVLDVRTDEEHRLYRLPGSVLVPVQELGKRLVELDRTAKWLVYCEHGRRSMFACEILQQAGFENLTNLRGGIAHWIGCGLPVQQ